MTRAYKVVEGVGKGEDKYNQTHSEQILTNSSKPINNIRTRATIMEVSFSASRNQIAAIRKLKTSKIIVSIGALLYTVG